MKIGEIARRLNVSTATVRNHVRDFGPYLSETARRKTGKRFTTSDLVTLRTIRGHLNDGLKISEISDRLTYTPEIANGQDEIPFFEAAAPTSETAITMPQVSDFVQQALTNQAQQHQREIDALNRLIEKLENDIEAARRPWWKRLL